jgi:hypothetical protein
MEHGKLTPSPKVQRMLNESAKSDPARRVYFLQEIIFTTRTTVLLLMNHSFGNEGRVFGGEGVV